MAKKVAVLAVNPVNGFGLFQYLETFFENKIPYKVFAVADSTEIKSNSGVTLIVDDVIANLKGHEDEYDALVFGCGDAVPQFGENAGKPYNQDMLAVIKAFGDKGKIMIGHCAAAQGSPQARKWRFTHWQNRLSSWAMPPTRNRRSTETSSPPSANIPCGR